MGLGWVGEGDGYFGGYDIRSQPRLHPFLEPDV